MPTLARKSIINFVAIKPALLNNLSSLIHSRCIFYHPVIETPIEDFKVDNNISRNNWLIAKLSKQGRIYDARKLFDEMSHRDVVTWTAMISGYIKSRMIGEARKVFDRGDAVKDVVTWTAMISGYVRFNKTFEAEKLFKVMPVRNIISWNVMIDGYVQNGRVDTALQLFDRMGERNVVSWNTVFLVGKNSHSEFFKVVDSFLLHLIMTGYEPNNKYMVDEMIQLS